MTIYRTNDPLKWGPGKGANLTATEVDTNFWELGVRITKVETNPAQPKQITQIQVIGTQMTIFLSDGTVFGPYTLPSAMIRYRGDWAASIAYAELDLVLVPNDGVYLVTRAHTSATLFDRARLAADGAFIYRWLFPSAPAPAVATDAPSDGVVYGRKNGAWAAAGGVAAWADVTGKPATVAALPANLGAVGQVIKVNGAGTGLEWASDLQGAGGAVAWADITNKPIFFPPDTHTHHWDDIQTKTALVSALPATVGTIGYVLKAGANGTIAWAAESGGTGSVGAPRGAWSATPATAYTYSDTVTHKGLRWFCAYTGSIEEPGAGAQWISITPSVVGILADISAARTLSFTDAGRIVRMNNAAANVVTVPTNTAVAFVIGTRIRIEMAGAGQTSIAAASGVTIRTPETLLLRKQYSGATLLKIAANEWTLSGDLAAAADAGNPATPTTLAWMGDRDDFFVL